MSAAIRTPRTPEESGTFTAWQVFFTRKTHKIMVTEKQLAGWIEAGIKSHEHQNATEGSA